VPYRTGTVRTVPVPYSTRIPVVPYARDDPPPGGKNLHGATVSRTYRGTVVSQYMYSTVRIIEYVPVPVPYCTVMMVIPSGCADHVRRTRTVGTPAL